MTLLDKIIAGHEQRLAESLDVSAGLHAQVAELTRRLAESSAASDELRDTIAAAAKMIAERDNQIAYLKACLSLADSRINKLQDAMREQLKGTK